MNINKKRILASNLDDILVEYKHDKKKGRRMLIELLQEVYVGGLNDGIIELEHEFESVIGGTKYNVLSQMIKKQIQYASWLDGGVRTKGQS